MKKLRLIAFSPGKAEIKKWLIIMKLIICLTLIGVIQVQAIVHSQESSFTVQESGMEVREVIKQLENNSNYRFFFSENLAHLNKRVDINVTNANLEQVLDYLFKDSPLTYRILENDLAIIMPVMEDLEQGTRVTGKVTDANGGPLPGVNIVELGTTNGAVTDMDGNYSITVSSEDAVLRFSFVGYLTEEMEIGGQTEIDVMLIEDIQALDEVVVVGYGTQKKVNVTGAIDVIDNKQIQSRPSPTVSQLIAGQAPGIQLGIGSFGYTPGAKMDLDIRGMGSINGGSPYVLIDGFPGEIDNLNPEDIESISVLKDAAASAIYGARAPYGVILITTKSGQKNRKLSVNYNGSIAISNTMPLPKSLDSYTFARVHNEAAANNGRQYYNEETIDRIIAYQNEDWDYLKQFAPEGATHFETIALDDGTWARKWEAHANNDWYDILLGPATNHKHNFSVQGGSERTSYYFSAGLLDQEGTINYVDDHYRRINITGKIMTSLTDWWDFSYEPRFTCSNTYYPNMNSVAGEGFEVYTKFWDELHIMPPTSALYDPYGNEYAMGHHIFIIPTLKNSGNNVEMQETWHNFTTDIRPLKNWKIHADFAYRNEDLYREDLAKTLYYTDPNRELVPFSYTALNKFEHFHASNPYWTSNLYSSYDFALADAHKFHVLGGIQYEYDRSRRLNIYKTNLIVQDVPSLNTAIGQAIPSENLNHWSTLGYFGRFSYNYKEKYLLETNARYDGTSRFRKGKRWGFFPSFSLGWVPSKEAFWQGISPYVNILKFRGSWGQLGNQNVAAYRDLALIPLEAGALDYVFESEGMFPIGYTRTPSLVSRNLTWETVTTKNLGLFAAFFDQRLQVDFDVFERTTTDMIGPAESKPGVLGASVPESNNATLRTRGWETVIKWTQSISSDFSYFINFNLQDHTTVVTEYNNPDKLIDDWYEGKQHGEIWGYTSNGLFQTEEEIEQHADQSFFFGSWNTGDIKYEDLNDDGVVNNGDFTLDNPGDMKIIGNTTPRYGFGVSLGFNYKGFDFSTIWQGVGKRDLNQHLSHTGNSYSAQAYFGFVSQSFSSIKEHNLDYYRDQPGTEYVGLYEGEKNINRDAWLPRPYISSSENGKNRFPTTRYLLNGAYVRMQNIQLGYSLPKPFISKIGLANVRVYLSGDNLLTFDHLPPGIDPVAVTGYAHGRRILGWTYGADRIVLFGLDITY